MVKNKSKEDKNRQKSGDSFVNGYVGVLSSNTYHYCEKKEKTLQRKKRHTVDRRIKKTRKRTIHNNNCPCTTIMIRSKIVNRTYYNMTYVLRRTTVKFEKKGKVDKKIPVKR